MLVLTVGGLLLQLDACSYSWMLAYTPFHCLTLPSIVLHSLPSSYIPFHCLTFPSIVLHSLPLSYAPFHCLLSLPLSYILFHRLSFPSIVFLLSAFPFPFVTLSFPFSLWVHSESNVSPKWIQFQCESKVNPMLVQSESSETKWDQGRPIESKRNHVRPSETMWDQATPSETTWDQVRPSETQWNHVRPSGKWNLVKPYVTM